MNRRGQFLPLRDDNPTSIKPVVNYILIAVNVVVFLFSILNLDAVIQTWGFTPSQFSLLTIFTSMFLHASIAHIAGNMWFLFIFGDNVEERLGHGWYLAFYLACGVAASLTHYALNLGSSIPSVGASGAISGVLGAYLVFYPKASVYVSGQFGQGKVPAYTMLGLWFGYQLINGFLGFFASGSGVAFWAHVGGFVAGVLIAWLVKNRSAA
jgi:membrane associated rhomboid family serine protease